MIFFNEYEILRIGSKNLLAFFLEFLVSNSFILWVREINGSLTSLFHLTLLACIVFQYVGR
jgi:hypothetical protein